MSEKFNRKYSKYLDDRKMLLEKQLQVIEKLKPLIEKATGATYAQVCIWGGIVDDVEYLQHQIIRENVEDMSRVKVLLSGCSPNTSTVLNHGDGFKDVELFTSVVEQLGRETIEKLKPVTASKVIMSLIAEVKFLSTRENICKITANMLSGGSNPSKFNWYDVKDRSHLIHKGK